MIIETPSVELLSFTPMPERLIERAGRVCWKSEERMTEDSAPEFIHMIKGKNHASVLEHASAGFLIKTDRGISHEIVRHRIASFSQESTRYCNYSKDKFANEITVIRPCGVPLGDLPLYEEWFHACKAAERQYFAMLKCGASPQIARSVLPTCLKTEIAMTANLREWLHFLDLRTSPAAHPDIQIIANMIRLQLLTIAPTVFEDFA